MAVRPHYLDHSIRPHAPPTTQPKAVIASHLSLSLRHESLTGALQPEGGPTAARLSGGPERVAVVVMGSLLTECEVDKGEKKWTRWTGLLWREFGVKINQEVCSNSASDPGLWKVYVPSV